MLHFELILSALCLRGISRGEVGLLPPSEILEKAVVINKIYIVLLSNCIIELSTKYPSSYSSLSTLSYPSSPIDKRIFRFFYTNHHADAFLRAKVEGQN